MGSRSRIEWTEATFNPWIGCTKVSPGCTFCYAERDSKRWGRDLWGPGKPRMVTSASYWQQPRRWNRVAEARGVPMKVFCASFADVFDAEAPEGALERLWDVVRATPWLRWQMLTKRADRIASSLPADWGEGYPNVWLGVSAESQAWADERLPYLAKVPCVVRFVSAEPLLGPLDLSAWLGIRPRPVGAPPDDLAGLVARAIGTPLVSWVISGGESGPKARPLHPAWVRSLRDQCAAAGVAYFFKQFGEYAPATQLEGTTEWAEGEPRFWAGKDGSLAPYEAPLPMGEALARVGKKAAGAVLDGREHRAFPEGVSVLA